MNTPSPLQTAKDNFIFNLSKGRILQLSEFFQFNEDEDPLCQKLLGRWYKKITELTFLPSITEDTQEIAIHNALNIIVKERNQEYELESDLTQNDLELVFELIALNQKVNWNYKEPFASFYSKIQNHATRISLIHHSASSDKYSKMFIRVLNQNVIPLTDYTSRPDFFTNAVLSKKNILIAGATGSGKTTFTNSLLSLIPKNEHTVLIEDTQELIAPHALTTKLLTEDSNSQKTMNAYLTYTLRMSPKRIILGELRGKEVESYLLAMNTGHNGLLSTIHANSALDSIYRFALLFKIYSNNELSFELILKLITKNIDYVCFIKNKKLKEVIEIFGSEKEEVYYDLVKELTSYN